MKRLEFDCVFDLADTITALLGDVNDDYPAISVYGKYDVIKELLEDLIISGTPIVNGIELEIYDIAHYNKEFELSITEDGVSVCKLWHDDNEYHKAGYYNSEANIAFIHEDCNSKLLNHIESETVYEFGITDDEYIADIDCCNCADEDRPNKCLKNADKSKEKDEKYMEYSKDKDGDIHGFTASKYDDNSYISYSYYTSEKLDNNDVNKILKMIGF